MRCRVAGSITLALVVSAALAGESEPSRKVPADFKLSIAFFGFRKEPIDVSQLIFWKGRAFQLRSDPTEVVVYSPDMNLVELLDLKRLVHTEIPLKSLDDAQARLHRSISSAIEKREKKGGRADRVAAEMTRSLINPSFKETFDDASHRLRLSNPNVEVDATGERDDDSARLAMIADSLTVLLKLSSYRDPVAIPPFARLDAIRRLTDDHHLRPGEFNMLYRLAGTPQKFRWTYRLKTSLSTHEVEVLARLSAVLERSRYVRFEKYEREN